MLSAGGLETFGLSQLIVRRDTNGNIILLVAKVTDDFLIGGSVTEITRFIKKMNKEFHVGKTMIDLSSFSRGAK